MKDMSLTEHLEELRKTMIRVVLTLAISFFIAYGFGQVISEFLLAPLRLALSIENSGTVVYLGLLDKVLSQFQVAFWTSIIGSAPIWFFLIWRFIKPGLHGYEINAIRPFIIVGFILFCAGVCFGYFLVFPMTFQTLMQFGVQDVTATISLKDYLILASKVLVFLGIIFQLPNVMLILGFMGIVTKYTLRSFRSYVYVGFAVISSIMTPPDVITMMGLWVPLVALYEVGILAVALVVHPYLARQHK